MVFSLGGDSNAGCWPARRNLLRLLRTDNSECALGCCENFVFLESRGDNIKGVNLGRSLDESCQRLQHLGIGICVVSVGVVLVIPKTNCRHIHAAGTSEYDFVLESILSTKQGKDILLKSPRVIG